MRVKRLSLYVFLKRCLKWGGVVQISVKCEKNVRRVNADTKQIATNQAELIIYKVFLLRFALFPSTVYQ